MRKYYKEWKQDTKCYWISYHAHVKAIKTGNNISDITNLTIKAALNRILLKNTSDYYFGYQSCTQYQFHRDWK